MISAQRKPSIQQRLEKQNQVYVDSFQEDKKANSRSIRAYWLESEKKERHCTGETIGNTDAKTEAFDRPETKDVGPAGTQRYSKETELDR